MVPLVTRNLTFPHITCQKTNSLIAAKTCQGNTHGLDNQINDGEAQTNESHIMPKGMETFIKLRAGGKVAAGL